MRPPASSLLALSAGLAACVLGCIGPTTGGDALPVEVVAAVDGLIAECEPESGEPSTSAEERRASLDSVAVHDLNGDAYPDYVIDDSQVACAAGFSFRHGNGGTGYMLMVGGPDGARMAANALAFGLRVEERSSEPDRVWVQLGGAYCGQDTEGLSRAEMIGCERALEWEAESGRLVLGPMDEARFETD